MNTLEQEQKYIDSILSIQNEIKFWQNNYDNFVGKHGCWGRNNRKRAKEKIQFFTEQKEKLKKEFREWIKNNS